MTLYRPVHKHGTTALPHATKTAATLWIFSQLHPSEWRVESVEIRDDVPTDHEFLAKIQEIRV